MTYKKKAHRSRPAAGGDQQGLGAGEVDPARASEHAAPVVGAAAAGGGAGGDLRADGGRPVGASGPVPDREGAGEGAPAAVPDHRGPGAVGEHDQRGRCCSRRATRSGRAGARTCAENADHPRAKELFDRHKLPAFHDPFAGGGALPLEAQRLGLESYASDLNPVAVLINKAMIEIPPKFAGQAAGEPRGAQGEVAHRTGVAAARRGWPRTCATTASGCATRPRSASATSTRRSRSRPRWRRSGQT